MNAFLDVFEYRFRQTVQGYPPPHTDVDVFLPVQTTDHACYDNRTVGARAALSRAAATAFMIPEDNRVIFIQLTFRRLLRSAVYGTASQLV